MKLSNAFKTTIQQHLEEVAANDSLFAETLKKENKNIDDCITYILNTVKKSGCNGFADEEIFGMAKHYYDEDDIEVGKPISGKVVVNHAVELTEEDKAEAKKQAMNQAIEDYKVDAKKELAKNIKLSDDDIAEAKKLAVESIVSDQKEKLVRKKESKKIAFEKEEIPSLFD